MCINHVWTQFLWVSTFNTCSLWRGLHFATLHHVRYCGKKSGESQVMKWSSQWTGKHGILWWCSLGKLIIWQTQLNRQPMDTRTETWGPIDHGAKVQCSLEPCANMASVPNINYLCRIHAWKLLAHLHLWALIFFFFLCVRFVLEETQGTICCETGSQGYPCMC